MEYSINGRIVTLSVMVRGVPCPIYRRPSDNVPFIEALVGQKYFIRIAPTSYERLEVVTSVDGRNTLTNEPANPRDNRGMVITLPWNCNGYRIDDSSVAEFVFSDPSESMAAAMTGSVSNVGVIGVAVYREYRPPQPPYQRLRQYGGLESLGFGDEVYRGATKGGDVGTKAGAVVNDQVGHTNFFRASLAADESFVIHYRTRTWLERFGIIQPNDPNPWPGQSKSTGYEFLKDRGIGI